MDITTSVAVLATEITRATQSAAGYANGRKPMPAAGNWSPCPGFGRREGCQHWGRPSRHPALCDSCYRASQPAKDEGEKKFAIPAKLFGKLRKVLVAQVEKDHLLGVDVAAADTVWKRAGAAKGRGDYIRAIELAWKGVKMANKIMVAYFGRLAGENLANAEKLMPGLDKGAVATHLEVMGNEKATLADRSWAALRAFEASCELLRFAEDEAKGKAEAEKFREKLQTAMEKTIPTGRAAKFAAAGMRAFEAKAFVSAAKLFQGALEALELQREEETHQAEILDKTRPVVKGEYRDFTPQVGRGGGGGRRRRKGNGQGRVAFFEVQGDLQAAVGSKEISPQLFDAVKDGAIAESPLGLKTRFGKFKF